MAWLFSVFGVNADAVAYIAAYCVVFATGRLYQQLSQDPGRSPIAVPFRVPIRVGMVFTICETLVPCSGLLRSSHGNASNFSMVTWSHPAPNRYTAHERRSAWVSVRPVICSKRKFRTLFRVRAPPTQGRVVHPDGSPIGAKSVYWRRQCSHNTGIAAPNQQPM